MTEVKEKAKGINHLEAYAEDKDGNKIVSVNDSYGKIEPVDVPEENLNLVSRDFKQLQEYGAPTQARLGASSNTILEKLKTNSMGEVSNEIVGLIKQLKGADEIDQDAGPIKKLFNKIRNKGTDIAVRNQNLSSSLGNISAAFEKDQKILEEGVDTLDKLKSVSVEHSKELATVIQNGEDKLKQLDDIEIPEAKAKDQELNTIETNNELTELLDYRQELSRRLQELKSSMEVSRQTLVQLQIVQASQRAMYGKINQTLNVTVPQMKQQLVLTATQQQLKGAIHDQELFDEANNSILEANAKDFHENSVAAVKMINKTSVTNETLKNNANEIYNTLVDIKKINDQAEEDRKNNNAELDRLAEQTKALQQRSEEIQGRY